jgi:hypothetical protein
MSIELIPLATCTISLSESYRVSPSMIIADMTDVRFEGERLKASMKGRASADWLEVEPGGYGTVDVRMTLQTDDGALIYVTYRGRIIFETLAAYASPLFHTGDERYVWLNKIQAVGKGNMPSSGSLIYEFYELR